MSVIRRRGLSTRLFAATLIVAMVGPGPATAWARANDAQRAADARVDEWLHSFTDDDHAQPSAPSGAAGQGSPQTRVAPLVRHGAASADEILPVPLQPKNVRLLSGQSNLDPWALFDGKATSALNLDSSAPVRLAVELQQPQALAAITLLGPSDGSLTVFSQEEQRLRPIGGLAGVAVHGIASGWQRLPVEDRTLVSHLVIEWVPASSQGPVELGLWGRSLPVREATDTELADRILASSAPGALVASATPEMVTASRVSLGAGPSAQAHDGVVHVQLSAEPRAWSRAFLVYELTGLGHFTQAIRQINGLTPQGWAEAASGQQQSLEGGLQVEEISPEWLRAGDNEIRFLPLPQAGAPDYSVRRLRVVGVGHATLAEARLSDGAVKGGRLNAPFIPFERASQPHDLAFELLERSEGKLLVAAAGAAGRAPLSVNLHGLDKGWHRVELGSLPPAPGVSVALDMPGGAHAFAEGHLAAVSEVAVTASAVPSVADAQRIGVSYPLHGECRDHQASIHGFVSAEHGDSVVALRANGADVTSSIAADGSFALQVQEPRKKAARAWSAGLEATLASGRVVKRTVQLEPCVEQSTVNNDAKKIDEGAPYEQLVRAGEKKTLTFAGAKLEIPAGAVDHDVRISIRPLVLDQVPAMSPRVKNTSPGERAYRFGPHGLKFKKPVKITLPYDQAALEAGTSEKELFAFYYDEPLGSWQRIGRYDTAHAGTLTSLTEHFTDFITGVLGMPDGPGLKSFNANELKGIKVGDPAAGVGLIAPPTGNSTGSMNLQFPIELPPGRNGIQPSLTFTYNSAGSNGWLGMGWDLPISAIEIDTRFGVPKYDDALDRIDRYMLDGERLVPNPGVENGYVRRVEGRFDAIQRKLSFIGSKNCVTSWTVTDKRGTVFTYGGNGATVSQPGEPCNVFHWGLSKVQDTFGNRMQVYYFHDNDNTGDAFTAMYPSYIEYTAHDVGFGTQDLAPGYRVSFVLEEGTARKDVVISGRAGFQQRTRSRLDHVDVELLDNGAPSTLIRRYQLKYQAPSVTHFYKSLLASIAQQGIGGVTELDRHTFEYGEATTLPGTSVLKGFGDPITWGTAQSGSALSLVEDQMSGGSVTLGVGFPIISLTVNGGANSGSETTKRAMLDLNGDGLPDLSTQDSAFMNFLRPALSVSPPPIGSDPPHLYSQPITGFGSLGHSNKSGWNVGAGISVANVVGANVGYTSSDTDDDTLLTDINGDGFPDRVWVSNGKLTWQKNTGNNHFELAVTGGDVVPNTQDPNGDFLGAASSSGQLARINPIARWNAPFLSNAAVTIQGEITKLRTGGNGVDVLIYKNATPVWSRTFGPSDLAACKPKPMATPSLLLTGECDPASTGLHLQVSAGDSLYFTTSPHHDASGPIDQVNLEGAANRVSWDPTVTYDGKPSLLEPYGLPVYAFSQKTDHRLYRPEVQWVASAKGTVHLEQRQATWQPQPLLNKDTTSDDVTLTITRRSGTTGNVLNTFTIPVLAARLNTPLALDQPIDVEKGDSVSIEATSDTPVDLERLGLDLWLRYSHYYRSLSSTNALYDADVDCAKPIADQPPDCKLSGDPEPDGRIPSDMFAQPAHVSYRFTQLTGAPTDALLTPTVQTFNLLGSLTCSGMVDMNGIPVPAKALVQGVNELLYPKQDVTNDGFGNGGVSFGSVKSQAGGELMVLVYFPQPFGGCTGTLTWNGQNVPVNYKYADTAFYELYPDQTPKNAMSGGFHRWSAGFLNGDLGAFDPNQIAFPLDGANHPKHDPTQFFFGIPQHDESPTGRWSGPGGAYIAAGEFNATRGSTRVSGGGGGGLDSLRHASTWNFELGASVGPFALGANEGRSKTDLDFFDFNGDRYPDAVAADGTVQYGDGAGGLSPRTVGGLKDLGGLRVVHLGSVRAGIHPSDVHLVNDVATDGTVRKTINTGFSIGTDYGLASTTTDWIDVNGDGLPDAVQRAADDAAPDSDWDYTVRLNYGYRLGPQTTWQAKSWSTNSMGAVPGLASTAVPGVTIDSSTVGDLVNAIGARVGINGLRLQDNASNNVNFGLSGGTGGAELGGGAGFSYGFSRTMVDMVDVNGDGLTDQVLRIADDSQGPVIRVRLNLGDQFDTEETLWSNPDWGNLDDGGVDFSFAGSNAINQALGFRRTKSFTASFQFKVCFFLCVGASVFDEHGSGWAYSNFEDVNGDGRPDMVFKNKGSGQLTVKLNQTPKDLNLLKKVNRPLGGSFEVAYDRSGNLVRPDLTPRIDEPGNKYVMTQLTVADGQGHQYLQGFEYSPGYTERAERDDYGFAGLTATRLNNNATPYSVTEIRYNNQDFYRKHLVAKSIVRTGDTHVFNVQRFTYATGSYGSCASPDPELTSFPAETKREKFYFEGTTVDPDAAAPVSTMETRGWDCNGNLIEMKDFGDKVAGPTPPNDVTYNVEYASLGNNIYKPNHITATDHFGTILRDRSATYEIHGALQTLTDVVIGGVDPLTGIPNNNYPETNPTRTYGYDAYGNLNKVIDPRGYTLEYLFDDQTQTHRTFIGDSFGYASTSIPDLRFGTSASETDVNGNIVDFQRDEFGRLVSVDGPFDVGTSHHTITFSYSKVGIPAGSDPLPASSVPAYAVTAHRDVQHPDQPILTSSFADGLGRIIQTKKSTARDDGTSATVGMQVSGAIVFDEQGRLTARDQSYFEPSVLPTTMAPPASTPIPAAVTSYDVLDRVTSTQNPLTSLGGGVYTWKNTTSSYGFDTLNGAQRFATTLSDANVNAKPGAPSLPGFARKELHGVRGNLLQVTEQNRVGTSGTPSALRTTYGYDALEELLTVTDAKGNVTRATYDTVGQLVTLISPDMGRADYLFDLSGNLAAKQTANLVDAYQFIRYEYEFNRLVKIDYPNSPDVLYDYGTPIDAGPLGFNRAGRVMQETSEAGTKSFEYDPLGNVNEETWTLNRLGPTTDPIERTFQYDYDSFGRLLAVYYPGRSAEVVSYGYDAGGNLDTVTGLTASRNRTEYVKHIGYDEFEQRKRITIGSGITTNYTYDPVTRRLSGIQASQRDPALVAAGAPSRPFQQVSYQYDLVGNVTQIANAAPVDPAQAGTVKVGPTTENFSYDDLYQLKQADGLDQTSPTNRFHYGLSFTYDAINNITQKAQVSESQTLSGGSVTQTITRVDQTYTSGYKYAGGRPHAPTEISDTMPPSSTNPVTRAFSYDGNGNQSSWKRITRYPTQRNLTYSDDNRLSRVVHDGVQLQSALYDGGGQRLVKRANESAQTAYFGKYLTVREGNPNTKHIFAGDMLVASKFVPNEVNEECPACVDRASVTYFHGDQLGSTTFATDETQTLTAHEQYLPSGELWVDQASDTAHTKQPYLFASKELDAETGLYYFGARYYDPRIGVWTSPDPILAQYVHGDVNSGVFFPQNLALYGYAWNNPIRLIDPNGRDPSDPWYVRAGKVAIGIGYGTVQAMAPGGFILDTVGTPSKDVDFLAGKGAANAATGVVQVLEGGAAAGIGVAGELPSGGTATIVVAGGLAVAANGLANVATGLNAVGVAIKGSPSGSSSSTTTSTPPAPKGTTPQNPVNEEEALESMLGRKPTAKELANYREQLANEGLYGEGPPTGTRADQGGGPVKGGHASGARPSTAGKHEGGDARRGMDQGKEKGDARRRPTQ